MMGTNYVESAFKSGTDGWMQNAPSGDSAVAKGCVFVMNENAPANLLPRTKFGIPTGWTVQTATP